MPAISIDTLLRARMHTDRWCRNGMVVPWQAQVGPDITLNQVVKWCGKCLFRSSGNMNVPTSAGVNSRNRWRGYGHTGPKTEFLAVALTMTLPGVAVAAAGIFGRCAVTEVGGATVNVDMHYGSTTVAGDGNSPRYHAHGLFLVPVVPDQDYSFAFSDHGDSVAEVCARLVSAEIHEIKLPGHTIHGYLASGAAPLQNIYDSHRAQSHALANETFKIGGATCLNFGTSIDEEAVTRTSDVPANLFDDSVTTLGAHPRFKLDMRARNRRSKTGVAMRMLAFAGVAGSGVAAVTLYNSAGSFITAAEVEVTGSTPAWHESDPFMIPAVEDEYAIMVASDGAEEAEFFAVSLFEHDQT